MLTIYENDRCTISSYLAGDKEFVCIAINDGKTEPTYYTQFMSRDEAIRLVDKLNDFLRFTGSPNKDSFFFFFFLKGDI